MPDPEARYQTAREFADDLIMFRAGGPVRAVAEDLDATRRTSRRPDEVDAGRDPAHRRRWRRRQAAIHGERRMAANPPRPSNWPLKTPPKAPKRPTTAARLFARGLACAAPGGCAVGIWSSVSELSALSTRTAARARDPDRIDHRSECDLDTMDGTFQGQSFVLTVTRAAETREAEACAGGGPGDRELSEQRRRHTRAAGRPRGRTCRARSRWTRTTPFAASFVWPKAIWRGSPAPAIATRGAERRRR